MTSPAPKRLLEATRDVRRGTLRSTVATVVVALGVTAFVLLGYPEIAWFTRATLAGLVVLVGLAGLIHGLTVSRLGWRARGIEETSRIVGEWTMRSAVGRDDSISVHGYLVYAHRVDVGRVDAFIHVNLDEEDEIT